jgi:hypothetical protein
MVKISHRGGWLQEPSRMSEILASMSLRIRIFEISIRDIADEVSAENQEKAP